MNLDQGYDAGRLVERLLAERDHARALACDYEAGNAEARRRIEAWRAPLGSRRAALSYNHGIEQALVVLDAIRVSPGAGHNEEGA